MDFPTVTRRQALERAAKEASEPGRRATRRRFDAEAHADLWLKWANLLDDALPPGAKDHEVYLKTSLARQRRRRRHSRIEFYAGAGESLVNRRRFLETGAALHALIEERTAGEQERWMTQGDADFAWSVVRAVLRTPDQEHALCSRLEGDEYGQIATALGVPPARIRKWFSRDMPSAFERVGHGEVWRRLCQMMSVSAHISSRSVTPEGPREV